MLTTQMIVTQAGAVPVDAAAQAAEAARAGVAVQPPQPPITAEQVAQYVDPSQVAAYLPAKPPESDVVIIFDQLFEVFNTAVIASMFLVGMFLLARIIHAFMIHRSVRKAIETKSGDAGALIDKLNKPYDLASEETKKPKGGDDRLALVLIAIGFAIAGFGLVLGAEDVIRGSLGAALFPLLVGAALMLSRRLQKREQAEEQAAARG
ncbi:MAG: hypothetical protein SFV20_02335 [Sphingopyxis sp.]|nr:hypothetical protein [Sphingopyxis sp.]